MTSSVQPITLLLPSQTFVIKLPTAVAPFVKPEGFDTKVINFTEPPKIPSYLQKNPEDLIVLTLKREEYERVCKCITSYERTMKNQRISTVNKKGCKPYLPDINLTQIVREIPIRHIDKAPSFLQTVSTMNPEVNN